MPDAVDPKVLFSFRTPRDAILYLQRKGFAPEAWNWFDLAADAHARSFTVAKAGRLDVLQAIRNALVSGKIVGEGERDFVKRLTPELQKLGWWGKQIIVGPDGGAEVAQLGSPWRLRTIYRTNTFSAYNAARYRQQWADRASRPFWQYLAVMDARTRHSHAALNGRVFRFDDPIWQYFYPPWAYNCRCRVRALTQGDVDRRSLKVESSEGHLRTIQQEAGFDPRTGEVITRPQVQWFEAGPNGEEITATPQPGFGHNPALIPWQPDLDRYDYDLARWYVAATLQGPAFARTWQRLQAGAAALRAAHPALDDGALVALARADPLLVRGEEYAAAILDAEAMRLLAVQTQTVKLSDDTLIKQALKRGGQDFGLADYWQVQRTIEQAQVIVRQDDGLVLVFIRRGGSWYHAVVRRTPEGAELYLTSFRPTNDKGVRKAMQRGEVLKDAR